MTTKPDILVFEDSEEDYAAIADRLGSVGVPCHPLRARSRSDFLDLLHERSPGVILADVETGGLDPDRAVRDIRGIRPESPLILLASPETESVALAGLEAGAADYLLKPRLHRIGVSVRRALGERSEAELRQRLSDRLAVQEDAYGSLVENVPYHVFCKDAAGRFTFVNRRFRELIGRPVEDIIGRTDHDFFPGELARRYRDDDVRVMVTRTMMETVEQNQAPGREARIVKVVKVPVLDASGKAVGVQGMFWDITETRRTEERIARQILVLDRVSDAIVECDADGGVTFWNHAAERLYQRKTAEVLGRKLVDVLGVSRESFLKIWRELLVTGHWHGDMEHRRADGAVLAMGCQCTLVRNATGGVESLILVNHDLTRQRGMEAELRAARRDRGRDLLEHGIAHDLNNVLGPVRAATGLLRIMNGEERSEPAKFAELLSVIEESVETGTALVDKLRPGSTEVKEERADLGALVAELGAYFRHTFPPHVIVTDRVEEPLHPVSVGQTDCRRLLLNLVGNAREALPRGGRVEISAFNLTVDADFVGRQTGVEPGEFVVLSITDDGPGIVRGALSEIFKPYFTTKATNGGTGVGLAIEAKIVADAGGFIRVESSSGEGTVFHLFLPAAPAEPMVAEPVEPAPGESRTVLVVDDTPVLVTIVTAMLDSCGYRAFTAGDGREALAVFEDHADEIDLVVTDMRMPQLDGLGLVRELRGRGHETPVVVMTGMDVRKEFTELSEHLGVSQFLAKPFSQHDFMEKVRAALGVAAV